MIRHEINGYIYTVEVTLRRTAKSCASIEDFSTYDPLTDSYAWKEFHETVFAVVPTMRKQNLILVTLYLQFPQKQLQTKLRSTAKKILQQEFFVHVCGVVIHKIGKPHLFFEPICKRRDNLEDENLSPARILDLITHI